MHKIVHIIKSSSESEIISILVNGGQFYLLHQPLSLLGGFYKGMFMKTTKQKAFTPQVTYSTTVSNKRGYAVATNCVNPYQSGIKYWTTSFDLFPEIL